MTLNDLAKELHISRQAADKKLKKYASEMEPYVKRDNNGRFVSFDPDGLQVLRNLHVVKPKEASKPSQVDMLHAQIREQQHQIEVLTLKLQHAEELLQRADHMSEVYAADNANLKSELEQLRSHWFVRLLGGPKKQVYKVHHFSY